MIRPDLRLEKALLRGGCLRLAAVDEVGRGALAGPVTVGAVVITTRTGRTPAGLADSKLLTPARREELVPSIRRWAIEWSIGHAGPDEIDRYGIIGALRAAAWRALAALPQPVDAVLLDGNHDYIGPAEPTLWETAGVPCPAWTPLVHTRIKADLRCAGVAAASVLAKTARDRLLVDLARSYPDYGFEVNKGYGTPDHLAALRAHGPSHVHRRSWRLPCMTPLIVTAPGEG